MATFNVCYLRWYTDPENEAETFAAYETIYRNVPIKYLKKFTDEKNSLATNLSHKSTTALKLGRAAFMRTNNLDYRRGVANAVEDFCNSATTPDAQEGLKAFLEKREPIWK